MKLPSIVPKSLQASSKAKKRMIVNFAEQAGMVYFGYVSQRDDEHHIVRGFTVSTKHVDDHYCIGTHESYDVIFVERTDALHSGKKHTWHILEFDLKSRLDLPHFFVGSSKPSQHFHELLRTKYHSMHPITVGATGPYPANFLSQLSVYSSPAHGVDFERLIPAETAQAIARHFNGLAFEITEQSLYVYSDKSHLTDELLHSMLTNGLWLAQTIDINSQLL